MIDDVRVRRAVEDDLDLVKVIADANRQDLGFIVRPALARSLSEQRVLTADSDGLLVGFLIFRHRRDRITTLLDLCVDVAVRLRGVGKALVLFLEADAISSGTRGIRLKCPAGSQANEFYAKLGYRLTGLEPGRRRALNVWEKDFAE